MIDGITYVPDYLARGEHDQFLEIVDQSPWQRSLDHDVQVYGYSYNDRQRVAHRIGDIPAWATSLATRLQQDGHIQQVPNQLVVNSYRPGEGFWDHIDQSVFGEAILSVSLGSTCIMRFTREQSDASEELLLEPGSLLVLTGPSRWEWKHGIPLRASDVWCGREYERTRRISFTFRAIPGSGARTEAAVEQQHLQDEA
jgi:alkylated DNA repair dioxygenase AlkB